MSLNRLLGGRLGALAAATMMLVASAARGQHFRDDFEDGSATDGSPVTWSLTLAPVNLGTFAVVNNDLVFSPATSGPITYPNIPNYREMGARVTDRAFHDVDVRTRARTSNNGVSVLGIGLLDTHEPPNGFIGRSVNAVLIFDGTNRYMELNAEHNFDFIQRQDLDTTISPFASDVNLRFRIVKDQASYWAWPDGQPEPLVPQLTAKLPSDFATLEGYVGLIAGGVPAANPITYRFVDVVPEPSAVALTGVAFAGLLARPRKGVRRRVS